MKKRKLCMIFLLCLALMTLVAGCRSKKETNDQGNQKGTAIYYTNNDVTKLIMKKENVKLEGNQQQKVKIFFNFVDDVEIPVLAEPMIAESTLGRRKTA